MISPLKKSVVNYFTTINLSWSPRSWMDYWWKNSYSNTICQIKVIDSEKNLRMKLIGILEALSQQPKQTVLETLSWYQGAKQMSNCDSAIAQEWFNIAAQGLNYTKPHYSSFPCKVGVKCLIVLRKNKLLRLIVFSPYAPQTLTTSNSSGSLYHSKFFSHPLCRMI